jgi:hypothetical protein
MIGVMESYSTQSESVKDNVVFIHRSPLSCIVHGHTEYSTVLKEIQEVHIKLFFILTFKTFSTSIVLCWSDRIRQMERLGERNFWAKGAQQVTSWLHPVLTWW